MLSYYLGLLAILTLGTVSWLTMKYSDSLMTGFRTFGTFVGRLATALFGFARLCCTRPRRAFRITRIAFYFLPRRLRALPGKIARALWVALYRLRAARVFGHGSVRDMVIFIDKAYNAKTLWQINPKRIADAFLREVPRSGSGFDLSAKRALFMARTYQNFANDRLLKEFMAHVFGNSHYLASHPLTYPVCKAMHEAGFPFNKEQRKRAVLLARQMDIFEQEFEGTLKRRMRSRTKEAERIFNTTLEDALTRSADQQQTPTVAEPSRRLA
jgi:hypothetical protein